MTQSIDDIWADMQQGPVPKQTQPRSKTTVHREIVHREADHELTPVRSLVELPEAHLLQRHLNTMGDKEASRGDRLEAVTEIHAALKFVANPDGPMHVEAAQLFETCTKPLIKRLYDKAERVRVGAAAALRECWHFPGLALPYYAYLTPVLIDRLCKAPQFEWEPSEEARVGLAELLKAALTTNAVGVMGAHSQEVLFVLIGGFKDPHPEVKLVCLSCVPLVCTTVMHYSIWKEEHKALTGAVQSVLAHRHAKVRLAALGALDALVQLGGAAEYIQTVCGDQIKPKMWGDIYPETLPENRGKSIEQVQKEAVKHNFFAMMIHDGNNGVRKRFYQMLGNWLSVVEDKMDHEHQLAPYLLSGLSDNASEVRRATLQMLDRVGERYELDNELDFKDTLEYGQERHDTARWKKFFNGKLPDPFQGRPRLGARIFVKSHAYRMLPACIRELKETLFTETVRLRSAVLIRNILVLLEDHSTKFARNLLEAWVSACHDCPDDAKLIRTVLESASILAHFVGMEFFTEFAAPGTQLYDKHPAAATMVVAALLQGTEKPAEHAHAVWQLFIQSAAAESSDHRMRTALVQLMTTLLDSAHDAHQLDVRLVALSACELLAANEESAQSVSVEIPEQLVQLAEEHAAWLLDTVTEYFNDGRYSFSFCSRHRQVLRRLLASADGTEDCLESLVDTLEGGASSSSKEVVQETVECAVMLSRKPLASAAFSLATVVLSELVEAADLHVAAELAICCLECAAGNREPAATVMEMLEGLQRNCQLALEAKHEVLTIRQRALVLAKRGPPEWAQVWWPKVHELQESGGGCVLDAPEVVKNEVVREPIPKEVKRKKKIVIEEPEEEIEEIVTEGARQQLEEEQAAKHVLDEDDSDDEYDENQESFVAENLSASNHVNLEELD